MMKLGKNQEVVLDAISRHRRYYESCGWYFGTHKETVQILNSLVKKGLVKISSESFNGKVYLPVNCNL